MAGARDRRPIPRVSPRLGETEVDTNIERQAYEGGDLWITPMNETAQKPTHGGKQWNTPFSSISPSLWSRGRLAGARDRRPIPRVSPRLGETEVDTNIERQAYEGGDLWITPMNETAQKPTHGGKQWNTPFSSISPSLWSLIPFSLRSMKSGANRGRTIDDVDAETSVIGRRPPLDATFQNIADIKFPSDRFNVNVLSLVRKCSVACDHHRTREFGTSPLLRLSVRRSTKYSCLGSPPRLMKGENHDRKTRRC